MLLKLTMFRSPSGQISSKRVLATLFGLTAIVLSFLFLYADNFVNRMEQGFAQIIITFALLSVGNQALTTKFFENSERIGGSGTSNSSSNKSNNTNTGVSPSTGFGRMTES